MHTRTMTKADFDHVVGVIDHWWGGPASTFAQPVFFHELGRLALVAEDPPSADAGGAPTMVGFLLGFIADDQMTELPKERTGYVYLAGIHPSYRRRGVGRLLYERFMDSCQREGCTRMKAITTAGHEGSLRFHEGIGWQAVEQEHYAGSGRKRIVFTKTIETNTAQASSPSLVVETHNQKN
jgi:GNAT superfamily N-acetyltransferase